MNVLWGVETPVAATTRYRVIVPSRPLLREGYRIDVVTNFEIPDSQDKFPYDLVMLQRNSTADVLRLIHMMAKLKVPVGYDIDDDIFMIETTSPVFDLYMRSPSIPWTQLMAMRFSRGMTLSTPTLCETYKPINPNRFLVENCIDLAEWDAMAQSDQFSWDPNTVHLVWAGSNTHKDSLDMIMPALTRILRANQHVRLVLIGLELNPFKFLPYNQVTCFGWSAYQNYQMILRACDIGLAPLSPSRFNAAKSDLRLKEYSGSGLAIVASDYGEYGRSGATSEGVFLCKTVEDWEAKLSMLISNADTLKKAREASSEWVRKWDVNLHAETWKIAWENVCHAG